MVTNEQLIVYRDLCLAALDVVHEIETMSVRDTSDDEENSKDLKWIAWTFDQCDYVEAKTSAWDLGQAISETPEEVTEFIRRTAVTSSQYQPIKLGIYSFNCFHDAAVTQIHAWNSIRQGRGFTPTFEYSCLFVVYDETKSGIEKEYYAALNLLGNGYNQDNKIVYFGTAEERMQQAIQIDEEVRRHWTAQQIADEIGMSKAAVVATQTWKAIQVAKAERKQALLDRMETRGQI